MARPRTSRAKKKASGEFIAWSDLYYGGEVEDTIRPNGLVQKVVVSRNVIKRGESVTQAQIEVSDEDWEHLIESGSIRNYPIPDGAGDNVSPTRAFMASITDDNGDIDPNKLMALAAQNPIAEAPVINPPAEEGATLETEGENGEGDDNKDDAPEGV